MAAPADEFRSLLVRAQKGDAHALAQLTQRYEPQVRIVARVMLGPALRPFLDSVDLVQSVHRAFLVGLREDQFALSSPDKLVRLALTLVRRRVAQHWRRLRRQKRFDHGTPGESDIAGLLASLGSPEPDPAKAAQAKDDIRRVMQHLDDDDRQLIELRLDGFRTVEIAERFQIPASTLRMRLSRLREKLESHGVMGDCV